MALSTRKKNMIIADLEQKIEKKYSKSHIGEQFITTEGYVCLIIDSGSKIGYVTIKIGKIIKEVRYSNLKKGNVKYDYHPSVYGVGYYGNGSQKASINGKNTKAYDVWNAMLQRVYDSKYHAKHPTYKNVTVCKEWLNFQTFADWFYDNYKDGYVLDKDLLSNDKKIYSYDTCLFIPQELNSFLSNKYLTNSSGFIGVFYHKRDKIWEDSINNGLGKSIYLGRFNTRESASRVYQIERAKIAKEWQEQMRYILSDKAIANII